MAFAFHNILDIFSTLYKDAKATSSPRSSFFNEFRIVMKYRFFNSLEEVLQTIIKPRTDEFR